MSSQCHITSMKNSRNLTKHWGFLYQKTYTCTCSQRETFIVSAVTRELGFCSLIGRTAAISGFVRQASSTEDLFWSRPPQKILYLIYFLSAISFIKTVRCQYITCCFFYAPREYFGGVETSPLRPMLCTYVLWAWRDLYCATPAVMRDFVFCGFSQRTNPIESLLTAGKKCWGLIF